MPVRHDVRNDGFVFDGLVWRSPKSWKKRVKKGRIRARAQQKQYRTNLCSQKFPTTFGNAGEAGELFVAADLLIRGFQVTKPFNRNGAHDLHAKVAGVWRTIQVKLARVNTVTGHLLIPGSRKRISSDVIALADLRRNKVRYVTNTEYPLPKELQ